MQLSDDNVTKMDSNLSNSVSYTVTAWDPPVQEGDILSVAQIYDATQVGDILYVDSVP